MRGIGRASALAIAKLGAQVLVHYASSAKEANGVVAEIRKLGGRAHTVGADLGAPDGAHRLAQQVRAIIGDRLDILVANAGVAKAATIEETTVEDFDRLFARRSSWCSNCFRSCMKTAVLCCCPRLPRMPRWARCLPIPLPRARSIRWSSISLRR